MSSASGGFAAGCFARATDPVRWPAIGRTVGAGIAKGRWRCRDLQARIGREFGVGLHERTVGKLLSKLRFRRLSVRPQHPQSDPEAQARFRMGSPVS